MNVKHKEFIEGMELAIRICRNRAEDYGGDLSKPMCQAAETCAGLIRLVQVEIGSGRQPLPVFTVEETDEIDRIS